MKNLLALLAVVVFFAACSRPEKSFAGKEYSLINPQNGVAVSLNFAADSNRYYGKIVNNYFGSYEINGKKLKFAPAASTMMMGPENEMEAESNFLRILPKVVSYHFVGDTLVLVTDNKQELAFNYVGPAEK